MRTALTAAFCLMHMASASAQCDDMRQSGGPIDERIFRRID